MNRNDERKYMNEAFSNVPKHKTFTNNNGYVMTLFYTKYNFEPYCLKFNEIENYEKAKADNFKGWACHHRLEKEYTREELIKAGLYYNRPPDELIFLTKSEHKRVHCEYDLAKGFYPAKGHHWKMPEKSKKEMGARFKNLIWVNNGIVNKRVLSDSIPEGFKKGRCGYKNDALKGKTWIIGPDGRRKWI